MCGEVVGSDRERRLRGRLESAVRPAVHAALSQGRLQTARRRKTHPLHVSMSTHSTYHGENFR